MAEIAPEVVKYCQEDVRNITSILSLDVRNMRHVSYG